MQDGVSVFWCDDPPAAAQWYATVLGAQVETPKPGTARIRFDPLDLVFVPRTKAPVPPNSFDVSVWFTVDDLEGAVGLFTGAGAQVEGIPLPLGAMTLVRLRDPFGCLVGVVGPGTDDEEVEGV